MLISVKKEQKSTDLASLLSLVVRPSLVMHNVYPVDLLYRLVDKNGNVASEGALSSGVSLPIYTANPKVKLYISLRSVNYLWSTYTRVHSPTSPYPLEEQDTPSNS